MPKTPRTTIALPKYLYQIISEVAARNHRTITGELEHRFSEEAERIMIPSTK